LWCWRPRLSERERLPVDFGRPRLLGVLVMAEVYTELDG
jgi:hypothetical protein